MIKDQKTTINFPQCCLLLVCMATGRLCAYFGSLGGRVAFQCSSACCYSVAALRTNMGLGLEPHTTTLSYDVQI